MPSESVKDTLRVTERVSVSVRSTTTKRVFRMLDLLPHWWDKSSE